MIPIRIHLHSPEMPSFGEGGPLVEEILTELESSGESRMFQIVDSSAAADVVILLQTNQFNKNRTYLNQLKGLELIKGSVPVLIYSIEDYPGGFLPGIYCGLNSKNFDDRIHISWPSCRAGNPAVRKQSARLLGEKDSVDSNCGKYLFSFLGSCSSKLRRRMFDLFESSPSNGGLFLVQEIDRWFDHTEKEQDYYADVLGQSDFVLCPRGHAPYSHRIVESMALGKVPVILADDWVPFSIPEKDYFVQVKESRFADLEVILDRLRGDLPFLKKHAFDVYQKYFERTRYWNLTLERIAEFYAERRDSMSSKSIRVRLSSINVLRANGLLYPQIFAGKVCNVISRIAAKF